MVLFTSILTEELFSFATGQLTWAQLVEAHQKSQQEKDPLFEFGLREWSEHDMTQEVLMGLLISLPCAFILGRILLKITCTRVPFLRPDVQHAVISTLVGDLLLELLLPSLKCLPTPTMFSTYNQSWLETMWGLDCYIRTPSDALEPNSLFILLAVRTVFIVVGLVLSQGFSPIVITGGIATGKSTVVKAMVTGEMETKKLEGDDEKETEEKEEKKKDPDMATYYLVDCDAIGHEILLSPETLKSKDVAYSVSPGESVYKAVCKAFAEDDILTKTQEIDRIKLGTLVFGNAQKRKTLNKLTHPRIAWILFKRLFYGSFFSGKDLVLAEVPLLFESKSWFLQSLFCLTVMVTVESKEVQMQRLQARNPNLSEKECENRLSSQMPLATKEKKASYVLNNGSDRAKVEKDLNEIQQKLMDHIHGVGISVAQIVAIVIMTLIAGLVYQIHYKGNTGAASSQDTPLEP